MDAQQRKGYAWLAVLRVAFKFRTVRVHKKLNEAARHFVRLRNVQAFHARAELLAQGLSVSLSETSSLLRPVFA